MNYCKNIILTLCIVSSLYGETQSNKDDSADNTTSKPTEKYCSFDKIGITITDRKSGAMRPYDYREPAIRYINKDGDWEYVKEVKENPYIERAAYALGGMVTGMVLMFILVVINAPANSSSNSSSKN